MKLALYDPPGMTANALTKLGVPFTALTALKDIPQDSALMIGEDALEQPPEGPWREAVSAFVQKGGKALVLAQVEAVDFLPIPLTQSKHKCTISYVRAADHPVMAGLTDADLKWWAGDHYVSPGNFRKPLTGNWLPLADAGSMEGIIESPLIEEYDSRPNGSQSGGSYILCQYLVGSKALTAPQATTMLQNMLGYLSQPGFFRTPQPTALLAGTSITLRTAMDTSRLVYQDLTGKLAQLKVESFGAAIVDATALDAGAAKPLREFAQAGGKVMICNAAPAQQAAMESVLGIHVQLFDQNKEPDDVKNRIARHENVGMMSGISNHELFWPSELYLGLFRREGWWWADCGPRPRAEWLTDYFCLPAPSDSDKATVLTNPCALMQVPCGKGLFLVNQLKFDRPLQDCETTVRRLRGLLLTNLGCQVQSEAGGDRARLQRLAMYQFTPIDLSPYCNRGLREDKAAGIVGWSNQGENDMRAMNPGPQKLAGVDFDIAAGKSAVALYSKSGMGNTGLPKEVDGIKVGARLTCCSSCTWRRTWAAEAGR